jgi:hypothetical protein
MTLLVIQLGFETYSGYASLVAGWGDTRLIVIPPKYLILEPFFDAVRTYSSNGKGIHPLTPIAISGTLRPKFLRMEDLGIPT